MEQLQGEIRDVLQILEEIDYALKKDPVTYSKLRQPMFKFVDKLKKISGLSESLREVINEEIPALESIRSKMERYAPEEVVSNDIREEIEREILSWREALNTILSRFNILYDIAKKIEHVRELLEIENIKFEKICAEFKGIKTELVCMKEKYPEKEFQNCDPFREFEETFDYEYKLVCERKGAINPKDRESLNARLEEMVEQLKRASDICVPAAIERRAETPQLTPLLWISAGDDRFFLELSDFKEWILGRYDPGEDGPNKGDVDGLKVKDERNRVLKVFRVKCRWGCPDNDMDCTHHKHVVVKVIDAKGVVEVAMAERAKNPVYYSFSRGGERKRLERIRLGMEQRLYLWISGVYDVKSKEPVPVELYMTPSRRPTKI